MLPQLTPHYQDSHRKAPPSSRPPNIPQTPVKTSRPRPLKAAHLEEGKETEATIESGMHQQVPTSVGYRQRFNYNNSGQDGGGGGGDGRPNHHPSGTK